MARRYKLATLGGRNIGDASLRAAIDSARIKEQKGRDESLVAVRIVLSLETGRGF